MRQDEEFRINLENAEQRQLERIALEVERRVKKIAAEESHASGSGHVQDEEGQAGRTRRRMRRRMRRIRRWRRRRRRMKNRRMRRE